MASFTDAHKYVALYEGGYNLPYGTSGETYKGVDRKYHPNWEGWKIVDQYKRQFGVPKDEGVIPNRNLDLLVQKFIMEKFWNPANFGLLTNQSLANLAFDFYFHKPVVCIAALNKICLGSEKFINTLTGDVIKIMNANPARVYEELFKLRVAHYSNRYLNKIGSNIINYKKSQKGVLARAYKFPAKIA